MIKHRRKIYQEPIYNPTQAELKNVTPIGVTLPFNNEHGIFNQSYTNREQVLSNLKNLLLTQKGERIMQPEFGTDLQYYLFEPIVDEITFKETIVGEIRSALSMWMPYVAIQDVNMKINPVDDGRVEITQANNAIVITIDIYITGTNIYLPVQIFISETGGLTII